MIYLLPRDDAPIDQGDIFDGCPIVQIERIDLKFPDAPEVACSVHRVVVLTQTCDLANSKTERVVVAILHQAEFLVSQGVLKAADIRASYSCWMCIWLVLFACDARTRFRRVRN